MGKDRGAGDRGPLEHLLVGTVAAEKTSDRSQITGESGDHAYNLNSILTAKKPCWRLLAGS